MSISGVEAGDADGDADVAAPPRPAVRVADHDRDLDSERVAQRVTDLRAADAVGIEGHEQRGVLGAVGVRAVDRPVRRGEPEPVAHDEHTGHRSNHVGRLGEDELDELGLLVGDLGKLDRLVPTASTVRRSTIRPSAFDTILLVTTSASPATGAMRARCIAATSRAARSSPGADDPDAGDPDQRHVKRHSRKVARRARMEL